MPFSISNDLEWLSEIFNDTNHCTVSLSLWQPNFLYLISNNWQTLSQELPVLGDYTTQFCASALRMGTQQEAQKTLYMQVHFKYVQVHLNIRLEKVHQVTYNTLTVQCCQRQARLPTQLRKSKFPDLPWLCRKIPPTPLPPTASDMTTTVLGNF